MAWSVPTLCVLALALTCALQVNAVRVRRSNHISNICSMWGNFHFKTYDGDFYQFPGTCEYNLVSECHGPVQGFSVHVKRAASAGDPQITRVLVTIGDMVIALTKNLVMVNSDIVRLPHYVAGMMIEENPIYTKLYAKLGLSVTWNRGDAIMVEMDTKYSNRTCGLCGDFNGVPVFNEFLSDSRVTGYIEFGNKHRIHNPNDFCEDPYEKFDIEENTVDKCQSFRDECSELFEDVLWTSCRNVLNPEPYIQACMVDRCSSRPGDIEDISSFCTTLSEYSRQCSHSGGSPPNWRTSTFCDVTCPYNMVYSESGSPCMDTCTHTDTSSLCEEHKMDGCFCPPGTVFDDISERGCIRQEQCQCKHNRVYNSGEVLLKDDEECVCEQGRWVCKTLSTSAICAMEEGSHFSTFDGKEFTFHGNCYYVLSKDCVDSKFTILGQLLPCVAQHTDTCLKSLVLLINNDKNNALVIKDDGIVKHNGDIALPYTTAEFTVFRPSSFHIMLQTTFGLQIQVQLVPLMQLYITLDQGFRTKTCGLCGNFNMVLSDELTTPQGAIEGTATSFANSWKVQSNCPDQTESRDDPCSYSIDSESYAEHWCSKLKEKEGVFAKCHSTVNPENFYKRCKYSSCVCEKSEDCLCAVVSSYVRACASKGVFLQAWRETVCEKYTKSCPATQTFTYKVQQCQRTCHSLSLERQGCSTDYIPVDGCSCAEGLYESVNGVCVPMEKCPCYYNGEHIKPGKSINIKNEHCICTNGKLTCQSWRERIQGCPAPKVFFNCSTAGPDEHGLECAQTCAQRNVECYLADCESGCQCPAGTLDDGRGYCVHERDCPCKHDNSFYAPGSQIKEQCNKCTCKRGTWDCTTNKCPATCTIYGSGHYNTFDKQRFAFSGDCSYMALQDKCGNKTGTFHVITENVPCGTTGTTCSKAVRILLGSTELELREGQLTENKATSGDSIKYKKRDVGLYLVLEFDNGLTVLWDHKTTVRIILQPQHMGEVCGLCGNYNGNGKDDFTTQGSLLVSDVMEFVDSWKLNSLCQDATPDFDPCSGTPNRHTWAKVQCSIIKSDTFQACHDKVEWTPYFENCVKDSCSCDSGGDCECLCTAVAAYAQACNEAGVCVAWRTPEICPVYCDYYNNHNECTWHYSPCHKPCFKTCLNPDGICTNPIPHMEGCYPKCPEDKPIYDEINQVCVEECEKTACVINGTVYLPGEEIPTDIPCHSCYCGDNGKEKCISKPGCCFYNGKEYGDHDVIYNVTDNMGMCYYAICINSTVINGSQPCPPTTPPPTVSTSAPYTTTQSSTTHETEPTSTTGTTTIETTTPISTTTSTTGSTEGSTTTECVICEWTEWINVYDPVKGGGNDLETYENIKNRIEICDHPIDIECRSVQNPHLSLEEFVQSTGQVVQCNVSFGLECEKSEQTFRPYKCFDYEIRVLCCRECDLTSPTTQSSTTPQTEPTSTTGTTTKETTTTPITSTTPETEPTSTTGTTTKETTTTPITSTTPETEPTSTTGTTTKATTTTPITSTTPETEPTSTTGTTTKETTTTPITSTTPETEPTSTTGTTTKATTTTPITSTTPETEPTSTTGTTTKATTTTPITSTTPETEPTSTTGTTTKATTTTPITSTTPETEPTSTTGTTTKETTTTPITSTTPETEPTSTTGTTTKATTTTPITSTTPVTEPTSTTGTTTKETTTPISTTTSTTGSTEGSTTTECVICEWTEWINVYDPVKGGGNDLETYENIKNKIEICDHPIDIECRSVQNPHMSLYEFVQSTGQVVQCNVSFGLECEKSEQSFRPYKCFDYEIRVLCCRECDLTSPTTQSSTTPETEPTSTTGTTTKATTTTPITSTTPETEPTSTTGTTTKATTTTPITSTTPVTEPTSTTGTTTKATTTSPITSTTPVTEPTSTTGTTTKATTTTPITSTTPETEPTSTTGTTTKETTTTPITSTTPETEPTSTTGTTTKETTTTPITSTTPETEPTSTTGTTTKATTTTPITSTTPETEPTSTTGTTTKETTTTPITSTTPETEPTSTTGTTTKATTTTPITSTTPETEPTSTTGTTTKETTTTPITSTTPVTEPTSTTGTTTKETTTPISTTTSTTGSTEGSTTTECVICEWTEWINVYDPVKGGGNDLETYENIKNKIEICDHPIDIECRSVQNPHMSLYEFVQSTGQVVQCNVSFGLECEKSEQSFRPYKCFDYEIRVLCCRECDLTSPTTQSSTTPQTEPTSTTGTTTKATTTTPITSTTPETEPTSTTGTTTKETTTTPITSTTPETESTSTTGTTTKATTTTPITSTTPETEPTSTTGTTTKETTTTPITSTTPETEPTSTTGTTTKATTTTPITSTTPETEPTSTTGTTTKETTTTPITSTTPETESTSTTGTTTKATTTTPITSTTPETEPTSTTGTTTKETTTTPITSTTPETEPTSTTGTTTKATTTTPITSTTPETEPTSTTGTTTKETTTTPITSTTPETESTSTTGTTTKATTTTPITSTTPETEPTSTTGTTTKETTTTPITSTTPETEPTSTTGTTTKETTTTPITSTTPETEPTSTTGTTTKETTTTPITSTTPETEPTSTTGTTTKATTTTPITSTTPETEPTSTTGTTTKATTTTPITSTTPETEPTSTTGTTTKETTTTPITSTTPETEPTSTTGTTTKETTTTPITSTTPVTEPTSTTGTTTKATSTTITPTTTTEETTPPKDISVITVTTSKPTGVPQVTGSTTTGQTTTPGSTETTSTTGTTTKPTTTPFFTTVSTESSTTECFCIINGNHYKPGETIMENTDIGSGICLTMICSDSCIISNTTTICPTPPPPLKNCTWGSIGFCEGWGDPHYRTFDGLFYSYQGECTYVLMEEIRPKHHLKIYIDNVDCDPLEDVSCPRAIIVSYNGLVVTMKNHNLIGAAQLEVLLGQTTQKLPFERRGVRVVSSGLNLILEISDLDVVVMFGVTGFSVNLPFHFFGNNTQGHCGTCNNNQADDCMLPGGKLVKDCAIMANYWQAKDLYNPECKPPPVVPETAAPTKPPCPINPVCELLNSDLFKDCHPHLSPDNYFTGCQFDSCHVSNPASVCTSLQTYAIACSQLGICTNWRNHTDLCTVECPADKVYKACGPADPPTCKDRPEDHFLNVTTEGCFCPDGMYLFSKESGMCVEKCGCLDPSGKGREFGERFEFNCQDCVCDEASVSVICKPKQCSNNNNVICNDPGMIVVNVTDPTDACCTILTCHCDSSTCPSINDKCPIGYTPVLKVPEGKCCPELTCEPKKVCVHKGLEYEPGTSIPVVDCQECTCTWTVDSETNLYKVQCGFVTCNEDCEPGYTYVESSTYECCGKCVKSKCIVNYNGTMHTLKSGAQWTPPFDNCNKFICTMIDGEYVTTSYTIQCPPFNVTNCQAGTLQLSANGCCPVCVEKDKGCKVQTTTDYITHNNCRSKTTVRQTHCQGHCNSYTKYTELSSSSCSCCQASRHSNRTVTLDCLNGDTISHTYFHVEECSCDQTKCLGTAQYTNTNRGDARRKRSFSLP